MIRHFEILQFDNKSNLGIIQITELCCAPTRRFSRLREIYCFIYFPTPLYTKTRCQAGFCVFSFLKKRNKRLFTVYRATLAALTIRLAGGRALHLNRRFGLRPGESKVFLYPCSCFQERGFLFLGMLQVQSPCQGARPQAGGYLCGRVAAQPPLGQRSVKTGLQVRSALQAKAWTFIYNLNPPTAHRGSPAAAPPPPYGGSKP